MKKLSKVMVCSFLAVAMILSCLTGCMVKEKDSGKDETKQGEPTQEVKEPSKISILTYAQAEFEYSEKMPVLDEIAKKTNTEIDWQNLPVGAEQEKIDLIFASGKLPDVLVWAVQDKIMQFGNEGALIPLENLVNEHAPNIKSAFARLEKEIPGFNQKLYSLDKHLYNIPTFMPKGTNAGMVWAIREDWCKNVGMDIPETTDELYEVLKAFKEKDPNKNGQEDELPLVCRNANYYLMFLANSFGTYTGLYWDDKDQQIKYGLTTPEAKEAFAYINKLYSEGLIDPEYITNTDDQFKAKIVDNRAGMFLGYINSHIEASHIALKEQNESYNLVPMLPVKGPNGDRFKQAAYNRVQYRASVTKSCKNPEAAIKLFDYAFSPEGHELINWGIKEKTYDVVNGQKQILDYVKKNPDGLEPMQVLNSFGINNCLPHEYDADAYFAMATPFVEEVFKLYGKDPSILKEDVQVTLSGEESQETPKYSDAFKYMAPMQAGFITGKEPLSKWDEYIKKANELGLDKFCEIYTNAYKRQYGIK